MKRTINLLLLTLAVFLWSCQEKTLVSEAKEPLKASISQHERKNSIRNQLTNGTYLQSLGLYQSMSSAQKLEIWTDKLNDVLERATLTSGQASFLNAIIDGLSQSSFEDPMDEETTMTFLNQAQAHFNYHQTLAIFCTPFDFDESPEFGSSSGEPEQLCHCQWSISCTLGNAGTCSGPSCSGTSSGCGWLWMGGCNFTCDGTPLAN